MLSFTLALCHDIIPILWLTWVLTSDGRLPYVYGLSVPLFTVAGIDNPPPTRLISPIIRTPLSLHCPGMFAPSTNIVSFLSYQSLARNQPMDMRKRVVLFLHNQTIRPGEFRKEFHWESVRCLKNLLWINNMPVLVKSKTPWYMKTLITWFWLFVVFKKYTIGYCCKTVPLLLGEGNLWLSTRTSDNRSAAEKKSNTKFKRCLIVEYCVIMIDNKI